MYTTTKTKKHNIHKFFKLIGSVLSYWSKRFQYWVCLFGGGGPQMGDVTWGGSPTFHANLIKLKWEIIPNGARFIISSPAKRVHRSWLPRGSQGLASVIVSLL